jgi:hypothetical protein
MDMRVGEIQGLAIFKDWRKMPLKIARGNR